jgi:shikimate kinase
MGRLDRRLRLALVGNMGAGKSRVARLVATALSLPFTDLDALVELRLGHPIAHAFATQGEAAFRAEEQHAVDAWLSSNASGVLALGGGSFAQRDVRDALADAGVVSVYLHVTPEQAWSRVVSDGLATRPMLLGSTDGAARLRALYEARDGVYRTATHVVDGEQQPAEVARAIVEKVSAHA